MSVENNKVYQKLKKEEARDGVLLFKRDYPHWHKANKEDYYYIRHWLPEAELKADQDETVLGDTKVEDYLEFTDLIHATHIDAADQILEDDSILRRPVSDNCYMKELYSDMKCVWLAPGSALESPCKYGPIVFHASIEILLTAQNLNWYWIEILDYKSQSATRILVTSSKFSKLKPYNPKIRGNPWYWNAKTNKHYYLPSIKVSHEDKAKKSCG